MEDILFKETQSMMGTRAAIALDALMLILWTLLTLDYLDYVRIDVDDVDLTTFVICSTVIAIAIVLTIILRMTVTVTSDRVLIKTISTRIIERSDIESIELRKDIHALREYGGWGIKYWIKG